MTTYEAKKNILAEFYIRANKEDSWIDFFRYNNIGLPLAYLIVIGLVDEKAGQKKYIEDTYAVLLHSLGIEDNDYEWLHEVLGAADGS